MNEKKAGFTLMEMMISIAIIGILVAIAVPPALSWRANTRFIGTVQSFAADIKRGKMVAIRENNDVGLEMNQTDYTIYLNLDSDTSLTSGDEVLTTAQLPPGYTLAAVPSSSYPVSFYFDGRGTAKASIADELVMQVTANTGRTGFVRVNMLGRVGHTFQ